MQRQRKLISGGRSNTAMRRRKGSTTISTASTQTPRMTHQCGTSASASASASRRVRAIKTSILLVFLAIATETASGFGLRTDIAVGGRSSGVSAAFGRVATATTTRGVAPAAPVGPSFGTRLAPRFPASSDAVPSTTRLQMSDSGGGGGGGGGVERERKTKKKVSTIVKDRVESKQKEDIKDETQWRVLLHNDEVHSFQYVTQSLVKVIGTLNKKQAFEICVITHNSGKASVTKAWKKQAEKFCLGLQRQGLTASIAPDSSFKKGGGDDPGQSW